MAHIRRLPSGNFNAVVRLPNGKRKSITDPLKRVVKQRADDLEGALRRGEAVHLRDRRVAVDQWHARWWASRAVEPSTARKEESNLRLHVLPYWGSWPLESIGRRDVQAWVKDMTDRGVGPHAASNAYQLLSIMLSEAVDEGLIAASPCRRVTLPRRSRPEPRWLTRHEYDRLQLVLEEPVWRAWVGVGCFSGLRPGELAGLDAAAVDFDRHLVRVTQVLTRQGVRPYPKSARSVRSVPFPEEVGELLWTVAADRSQGPLFTVGRGARVQEGNFRNRVWLPALAAAGIEPVRPYVMRHTCASWLVQAGVPDRKIMQILGHADGHLIDVYAHLAPNEHDDVRAAWQGAAESWRRTYDARPSGDDFTEWQVGRSDGWSKAESER